MSRVTILLAALLAVVALCATTAHADFGSYVVICDETSSNATFVNFPLYNCLGEPSLYPMPINQCFPEMVTYSWNGFCNQTNMWYNNFNGTTCDGNSRMAGSLLTRMYTTMSCQNCLNVECKNGDTKSVYTFLSGVMSPRK